MKKFICILLLFALALSGCHGSVERKEFVAWCKVVLSFSKTQLLYEKKMKDEPNGLYIVGEMDHFFRTMLRSDVKRIKHLAVVENAGHICCIDQYRAVNDLIVQFVETGTIRQNAQPAPQEGCVPSI